MANKLWLGTDAGNEGDWGTAANWSPSGVPTAADDVILANSSQSVTGGLDQSAVALTSITIDQSYTGLIGTESTFLQVRASTAVIGQVRSSVGTLTGSKRLNLDFGSAGACDIQVYNTASRAQDTNRQPCRIIGSHASHTLTVYSGSVAVSDDSDDTSQLSSVTNSGSSITIGEGVTLATLTQASGNIKTQSSITTVVVKGGVLNFYDSTSASTITTCTVQDTGILNHYASGTITTLNCNGGSTDLTKSQKAKTVTNLNLQAEATLAIDTSVVTLTNDIVLQSSKNLTITAR